MSRFFNASDSQRSPSGTTNETIQLQEVLSSRREAELPGVQLADSRLGNCNTIQIPQHGEPILLPNVGTLGKRSWMGVEAYRGLRTRLLRVQANGLRSLCITSATQGEGKTLTTMNLALSFGQLPDSRVLVVDGDLRTGGLTNLFGRSGELGLGEVLEGKAKFEDAIVRTNLSSVYLCGAGNRTTAAPELFVKSIWKDFIGWCVETFSLVVVDCTPIVGLSDFELTADACGGVLLVVRSHYTQRDILRDSVAQLDKKKVLGIVFNGEIGKKPHHYYGYYYGAKK
jgi:capsular exopolysaccharide synthesis family protein